MKTYHKIQTLFLRDPEQNYKALLEGQFAKPEFEYLQHCDWMVDEKLDGTNIRILWNGTIMEVRGKTDNAQLHPDLISNIQEQITPDKLKEIFGEDECQVCLYGEGVGPGIQKGGGNYGEKKHFILFDVLAGHIWLEKGNVEDVAIKLDVKMAPIIDVCPIKNIVEMVREGFTSEYGDFIAEGIIARPIVPLTNRYGERVITKLKHSDFHGGH
jgi:hypothetical protein